MKSSPDIEVAHSNGELLLREVVRVVAYFRRPNLEMADRAAGAIRAFVDLVSPGLTTYFDYEGDAQDLTSSALDQILEERLLGPGRLRNATIELTGNGLYAPMFELHYGGSAIASPELSEEAGFLWCWVPLSFFRERSEAVLAYVATLAAELPVSFLYVSRGLAGDMQLAQARARRHPGLDISLPTCVRSDIGDRAAGSYWTTFLGELLTARIGGISAIRSALPPDVSVDAGPGGTCRIVLGPEPEIGDVNRRDLLPNYRALARLFDDHDVLHVPEKVVYFVDKQGLADADAMKEWHRRFVT